MDIKTEKVTHTNMATKSKRSITKVILKITVSITAIALSLCLIAFFVIRGYIHKMNLVTSVENHTVEAVTQPLREEILEEEQDATTKESKPEQIETLEESIKRNMQETNTPIMNSKNVLNILLIGTDTRKSGGSGRSDAMILISINKDTKKIIASSLLRDIYLQIPNKGSNRINAAYAFGGADLLLKTIKQNLKIEIDRYASIDFYAFMDVVDAIGGVTLDVTSEEIPVINGYVNELNELTNEKDGKDCLSTPGTLLLNGKQALGYARNRYVGYADFDRTARQRRVLEQIYAHVKKAGILELNKIMNTILPQITTNMTEGELMSLIMALPTYASYDIEQWSIPVKNSYSFMNIRGMAVLGIDFKENIDAMKKKIYEAINKRNIYCNKESV